MTTVLFVTAVYDLQRGAYVGTLWSALNILIAALPAHAHLLVWCAPESAVPPGIEMATNVTPVRVPVDDFRCFRAGMTPGLRLPSVRTADKDTQAYLALMNTKTEMVSRAAAVRPAAVYAWIDAGAAKMWRGCVADMARALSKVTPAAIPAGAFFAPGCWSLKADVSLDCVCWRYCGTFFAVSAESACGICDSLSDRYVTLITASGLTTWEVNLWALAESEMDPGSSFRFAWYAGDHNHRLLDFT